MTSNVISFSSEWDRPIYKILARNDTGESKSHQAGVLIPKAIRDYFPSLNGMISDVNPTIDARLQADLFVEEKFVAAVSTRFQYQTWAGTRRPEARVTDELGPMRSCASADDILVFQRASKNKSQFRLTLVLKGSPTHEKILGKIGSKRWGELPTLF